MLVGILLPVLRRLSGRVQALTALVLVGAGLALSAAWIELGAGHNYVLLIRCGALLMLVGAVIAVRASMGKRRAHHPRQSDEHE